MKQLLRLAMMSRRQQTLASYFAAGNNGYGQLAINNSSIFPNVLTSPVTPYTGVTQPDSWVMFSMRYNSVAAIKSEGSLWTAGENSFGQLGFGDTTHRNKFTKVLVESSAGSGVFKTDWRSVGVGTEHIAALDGAGNIWCAGRNDIAAVIGDGTATGNVTSFYNTALTGAPFREAPIVFKALQVGHRFNMGLDTNNDIWTWGNNGSRQLGRASPAGVANPTQDTYHRKVDPPGPWQKMFAGGYHAGALHSDGSMWLWGLSSSGQRGGATSSEPAVVARIGGVPWVDAYMGENTTFLRNENGDVYVMGSNTYGELGLGNTTSPVTTPTQLPGVWRTLAIDWWHAMGVQADGSLWAWGTNSSGQLGLGNSTGRTSPTRVGTSTAWGGAVVGMYASLAYRSA